MERKSCWSCGSRLVLYEVKEIDAEKTKERTLVLCDNCLSEEYYPFSQFFKVVWGDY